jgi:hypothetical protein
MNWLNMVLNKHWAYSLSKRMKFVKRKASLVPRPSSLVGKIRERKAWENLSRD